MGFRLERKEITPLMKEFLREVKRNKYPQAIDLGCGVGRYSLWLAEKGVSITGVDSSDFAIRTANHEADSDKINFVKADIINGLDFPDGSFDGAFCNALLDVLRLDRSKRLISEVLRVLKLSGVIYLSASYRKPEEKVIKSKPLYRFSDEEIESLLSGFVIIAKGKKIYEEPKHSPFGSHVHHFFEVLARKK